MIASKLSCWRARQGLCLAAITLLLSAATAAADRAEWSDTLERIATGVVSIRVDGTRAFDTEWNQSTQATGFVVDAERGLLLTNRHVVTPGPVVAQAIFLNQEELDLHPVYRDPVHDFGFFRFDPGELRFIDPAELPLAPEGAQIGREIRVVGNDAGEQLSILAGTIARLDRQAPDYGRGKYNDFNTFYFQAASGTSGGSSGSPVIDIGGRVVALNAGANSAAASSFFLPLDRVTRALELMQKQLPVPRGTLQTVFVQQPFAELRRLGLSHELEETVREAFPEQNGMLVVQQVVPGAPASGLLEPGDILVHIDSALITEFIPLEVILDDNVGQELVLEIQRGDKLLHYTVGVQDLHEITPDEYIEFGDSVVHDLSYQQARHFNIATSGVYIANPGYLFGTAAIPRGSVIQAFNDQPVSNLDEFSAVLATIADGERVTARYLSFDDPQTEQLRTVLIDRRWFPSARCRRDDRSGFWPCDDLAPGPPGEPPLAGETRFNRQEDARVNRVVSSLVLVNFDMPFTVSGVSERHYYGTGVIVDSERGWVVVDRNTVPVAMGDVRVTFAGSLEVPGRVEYIHPLHNLAVVAYDPALIGGTPVRDAEFDISPVEPGDKLWVVGLKGDAQLVYQGTEVASMDAVGFPLSRTLRFRDTNLETISVVNAPGDADGVLVNARGRVVSLWSSFAFQGASDLTQVNKGVPADLVQEMIDARRRGEPMRSLEVELRQVPLASARNLGLSEQWVRRIERHNPKRRQVLGIVRAVAGAPSAAVLRSGDLLLSIDDQPVNTFRAVERATQKDAVDITIWREGSEHQYRIETARLNGKGIDRALLWAGALLQEPHRPMAAQRGIEPFGVYVAYFGYGSPANRYGLWAGRRIVEVDGIATPDLDGFIAAVADRNHRDSVRLKTVTWNKATEVITLQLDKQYWPSYELRLVDAETGWQRSRLN